MGHDLFFPTFVEWMKERGAQPLNPPFDFFAKRSKDQSNIFDLKAFCHVFPISWKVKKMWRGLRYDFLLRFSMF
jgi:hypothetical protein